MCRTRIKKKKEEEEEMHQTVIQNHYQTLLLSLEMKELSWVRCHLPY